MITTVIIEDEKLIADELQAMLQRASDDVIVKAKLGSAKEAISYFSQDHHTDLIFSDIQLPDGLSFEIFNATAIKVPVVFVTAYDRFIVNAFEHNGIDYLLKPVDEKDIQKVLGKYRMLGAHFSRRRNFYELFSATRKRMLVKKGLMNVSLKLE